MTAPQVSVLMPVWRPDPRHFAAAVASVVAQTLPDWELIIVEDPSDIEAGPLLTPWADPRIRHQRNPARTSLIAQRNRAFALAQAPWVAMLDADDIAEPERLAVQLAALAAAPALDVLGAQLTIIDDAGAVVGLRDYPCDHEAIATTMRRRNPLAQSALVVRRAAIAAVGGYTYDRYPCGEDYDLWCRMLRHGARFGNHPERLVRYRVQPGQLKRQRLREHLLCSIDIKERAFAAELDVGDRARLWAERALLAAPPGLVMRAFAAVHLKARGSDLLFSLFEPRREPTDPPGR